MCSLRCRPLSRLQLCHVFLQVRVVLGIAAEIIPVQTLPRFAIPANREIRGLARLAHHLSVTQGMPLWADSAHNAVPVFNNDPVSRTDFRTC